LVVQDLATGDLTRLTADASQEMYLVWSPDSQALVYYSPLTNEMIWSRADGSDRQVLNRDSSLDAGVVSWSPESHMFVIGLKTGHLATYDLRTGDIAQLTSGDERSYAAVWSPDGDQIAFLREQRLHILTLGSDQPPAQMLPVTVVPPLVWMP
jgi:Tol biopolymer transport system component